MLSEAEIAAAALDLARERHLRRADLRPGRRRLRQAAAPPARSTPEETTVVVLTGTGLKATPRIAELLGVTL